MEGRNGEMRSRQGKSSSPLGCVAREAGGSGSSLPRATGKSRERVGGETVQAQAREEKVADELRAERGSPHQHAAGLLIGETRLFQRLTLPPPPQARTIACTP